MKVSIIVPVYNAEKYLYRLIDSVLQQTHSDYELILVNDGSTDNSYSLMKKYHEIDNRIKVFSKKNTGPGMTRKFGFERSTGDLLFFVDSDDWISTPETLSKIVDIYKNNPKIDILFFDREDIIGKKKDIIRSFKNTSKGMHDINSLDEEVRPGLGSKVLRRNILQTDMFYESNVFEDLYTTFAYLEKCNTFYYAPTVFYTIYHEENSSSLSSNQDANMFNKSLKMILLIYRKTKKQSLKFSLELRMTTLFTSYWRYKFKNKTDFTSPEIKKNVHVIAELLRKNRVVIKPNNRKLIKKIIYVILIMLSVIYI